MSAAPSIPFHDDLTLLPAPVPVSAGSAAQGIALWWAAGVVVLCVGVWLWRRSGRGGVPTPASEPVSARREAERALQPWLGLAESADEEERRRGAVAVSAAVRRFVEARLGVPASRLTLEELRNGLLERQEWPERFDAFWPAFMAECERVNYAGGRSDAAGIRRMAEQAIRFVRANAEGDAT